MSQIITPTKFPAPFIPNTIQSLRIDLSISQVTSLNSTPIGVLPNLSGYTYVPLSTTFIRSGSPFLAQPGSIFIGYYTNADVFIASFASFPAALNVLTQAGTKNAYSFVTYNGTTAGQVNFSNFPSGDGATEFGSKKVKIGSGVGNPTVDAGNPGSACVLLLNYLIIPTYAENVGSY